MKTKDGVEVKIGQVWRDCDKRSSYRQVIVVGMDTEKQKAQMSYHGRLSWVSVRRMYRHSTGYELVS